MPDRWIDAKTAQAALGVKKSQLYDLAKAEGWRSKGRPRQFHLDDVTKTWQDRQKETS